VQRARPSRFALKSVRVWVEAKPGGWRPDTQSRYRPSAKTPAVNAERKEGPSTGHTMRTQIWVEPVKRPDGRNRYTDRGLLLRSRLGGPDGDILCDRVQIPICETCRVLMVRGITGPFETRKPDIDYPCMTSDIASAAGLTVHEPDDGVVHFARRRPFRQDAVSRRAVPAPAREDDASGREGWPPTRTHLHCRTTSQFRGGGIRLGFA
jgi:hypothetical protein